MSGSQDRILDAAEHVVLRDGAAHLTLDAVAAEAQMSKGGVLYHFHAKEDLIIGMIKRLVDQYEQQAQQYEREDPCPNGRRLRSLLHTGFPQEPGEAASRTDQVCAGLVAAVATNPSLLEPLREHARAAHTSLVEEAGDPVLAMIIHLAADGLWFGDIFGMPTVDRDLRVKVVERLLEMTRSV